MKQKNKRILIWSIIVLIIILVGWMYMGQSKTNNPVNQQGNSNLSQSSNDLNSLGQEISATDTNTGVDASQIQ